MMKIVSLALSFCLLCCVETGCASMRRHPVIYGVVIGGVVGTTYGLTHREGCPSTIDGYSYNGYGHPCPSRCDKDGCYWPGGSTFAHR